MYARFWKRIMDFTLSLAALVVLSPVLTVLAVVGAIKMRGNPFFVQARPGRMDPKTGREKIFKLIKLRTMTNKRNRDGNLLPDDERLTAYGRWLRSTSADELFELVNILKGDMSIVGPRPLLAQYLPLYNERQRRRHEARPGLTGHAQIHGRNCVAWEERFDMDVWYVDNISFWGDMRIIFATIKTVFKREGINSETSATMEAFEGVAAPEKELANGN